MIREVSSIGSNLGFLSGVMFYCVTELVLCLFKLGDLRIYELQPGPNQLRLLHGSCRVREMDI